MDSGIQRVKFSIAVVSLCRHEFLSPLFPSRRKQSRRIPTSGESKKGGVSRSPCGGDAAPDPMQGHGVSSCCGEDSPRSGNVSLNTGMVEAFIAVLLSSGAACVPPAADMAAALNGKKAQCSGAHSFANLLSGILTWFREPCALHSDAQGESLWWINGCEAITRGKEDFGVHGVIVRHGSGIPSGKLPLIF